MARSGVYQSGGHMARLLIILAAFVYVQTINEFLQGINLLFFQRRWHRRKWLKLLILKWTPLLQVKCLKNVFGLLSSPYSFIEMRQVGVCPALRFHSGTWIWIWIWIGIGNIQTIESRGIPFVTWPHLLTMKIVSLLISEWIHGKSVFTVIHLSNLHSL